MSFNEAVGGSPAFKICDISFCTIVDQP